MACTDWKAIAAFDAIIESGDVTMRAEMMKDANLAHSDSDTPLTAVIALAAIGCCGLLYNISILLSRIHDDMPGPVRDQRLANEALVAKVKVEMEADGNG